jgi:NFU1 iron-sulfur cluster scaffold homolog, mitochondrial
MAEPLQIRVEATPNPNSLKFSANRTLWEGRAQTFTSPDQALMSPLARELLAVPGVKSVFFLRDFVTISRDPGAEWEPIASQVESVLRARLA